MLIRFLRLFPFVRNLELQLQKAREIEAGHRKLLWEYEDSGKRAKAEAAQLRDELSVVRGEMRDLQVTIQEQNTQHLVMQERCDSIQNDRSEWRELAQDARKGEREALQMLANFRLQPIYGITPFPDAVKLPDSVEPDLKSGPVVARRQMPSEKIARAGQRLVDDIAQRIIEANRP